MYLNFFGLQSKPFHTTPDPYFLYLSPSHKQALGSIIYGVNEKKGFIAVTGEVGLGKTTILRSFLTQSDQANQQIIYLFNPNLSFASVLKKLLRELGHDPIEGGDAEVVEQLHMVLIDEYYKSKTVVLLIDDAQNMPVVTLENLRMLSNLETSQDKLIQIVLLGQPELDALLDRYEIRQIRQRIALRATLRPLSEKESFQYIRHRLDKASGEGKVIFTNGALKRIVREANGIPRRLNILCDNALVTALGYQTNPVTVRIAKEVINDLAGKSSYALWKLIPLAAGALLLVLALIALMPLTDSKFSNSPSIQTIGHLLEQGVDQSRALLMVSKDINASIKEDALLSEAIISVQEDLETIVAGPVGNSSIQPNSEFVDEPNLQPSNSESENLGGLHSSEIISQVISGSNIALSMNSEVFKEPMEEKAKEAADKSHGLSPLETVPLDKPMKKIATSTSSEASNSSTDKKAKNVVEESEGKAKPEVIPQVNSIKEEIPLLDLSTKSPSEAVRLFSITKIMKKGDTLAGLMHEVYGSANPTLLRLVLSHNRHIVNVRKIHPGQQILFPPSTNVEVQKTAVDGAAVLLSHTGEELRSSKKIFTESSKHIKPSQKKVEVTRTKPYAVAVVQEGDTLEKLAKIVYGSSDPLYVQRVLDFNPKIQNPKKIFPGQNIVFPRVEEAKDLTRQSP